jgi:hypothetical protein
MPLVSKTLSGNAALQACLVNDQAHVTPGAAGVHVGLIQKCLLVLESSPLAPSELRRRVYGPTTTAAVLAYKRKRSIINRSYQTQADNIVGKMTIARLDEDIAKVERARTLVAKCRQCGGGGGVFGIRSGPAGLVRAPIAAPTQFRRALFVHFQRTDQFTAGAELFALELLARARQLLLPLGMTVVESPGFGGATVPWPDILVHTQFPVDRFAVRKAAVNTAAGDPKVLRVIFCPFDPIDTIKGITDGGTVPAVPGENVPKFVLINTLRRNPDRGTLVHEMIHASFEGTSPPHDDGNPRSLYSVSSVRDTISDDHVKRIAGAFFARPR